MNKIVYKAVAALLFLFISANIYGQKVRIQPVHADTKAEIKDFIVFGVKDKKKTLLNDTLEKIEFSLYDSISVEAEGYSKEWLKKVAIPILEVPVITLKVALSPLAIEVSEVEVVVSASKFKEDKEDIAQNIIIVNQKDIAFASQPTTADILQDNGNVLVQKSQLGGGSPIIRGFEANKVLVVIDGVRMNNAIYRGGHLQNVLRIDNNILERLEIVQGPGSVIYGSDALGGVMHFMTPTPQYITADDTSKIRLDAGAMARYASAANQLSGNFNFNVGGKKLAWLASFSYSHFGDLRQGSSAFDKGNEAWKNSYYVTRIDNRDTMLVNPNPLVQTASGYEQVDILQKLKFEWGNTSHLINFQYSLTGNVPRYDRLSLTDSGNNAAIASNRFLNENPATNPFANAEWYYGPEERMMLAYTVSFPKKDKEGKSASSVDNEKGRITASWQNIKESRHSRGWQKTNRTDRFERVQFGAINADFQTQKGKHEFRYGGETIFNTVTSTASSVNVITGAVSPATTRYPGGGSNMFYGALYGTYNYELGTRWVLNTGLRANLVTLTADFDTSITKFPFTTAQQQNQAINGQAGAVYKARRGWRFAGRLATGFRAPNVDDMGKVFDSDPKKQQLIVPNRDLKPEYTYTAEVKISKRFNKTTIIEAVGWYTLYRDAIVTLPFTLDGSDSAVYDGATSRVYASQNAGNAYLYGTSLNFKWGFMKDFELTGAVNYTYGRMGTESTPYPLDHIPPVFGRAGVKWLHNRVHLEFFTLFNAAKNPADYNMVGEDNYFDATIDGSPAWYTLNLRGTYIMSENIMLQLAVENILDRNYRVFGSGISAPGINMVGTIRVQL